MHQLIKREDQQQNLLFALAADRIVLGRFSAVKEPGQIRLVMDDETADSGAVIVVKAVRGSETDERIVAAFRRLSGRMALVPVVVSKFHDGEEWQVMSCRTGGDPILDVEGQGGVEVSRRIMEMRRMGLDELMKRVSRHSVAVSKVIALVQGNEITALDGRLALESSQEGKEAILRGLICELLLDYPKSYTERRMSTQGGHGYECVGQVCQVLLDDLLGLEQGSLLLADAQHPSLERVVCAYAWAVAVALSYRRE